MTALETAFAREPLFLLEGVQANTSPLPYAALDGAADLQSTEPEELAAGMARLYREMGLRVFGGCCGTDARHMEAIAREITQGGG